MLPDYSPINPYGPPQFNNVNCIRPNLQILTLGLLKLSIVAKAVDRELREFFNDELRPDKAESRDCAINDMA
nr:hypothetical protein HmN_000234500 [Hymenolepis microstoma]